MTQSFARASTRMLAGMVTLLMVAGLTGCADKSESEPAPPPAPAPAPEPPPVAPTPKVDPNAALDKKIDTYARCFNSSNQSAHQAMSRYSSWVGSMTKGPTGSERTVFGIYTVPENALKKCGEPLIEVANTAPSLNALDTAAKIYSVTINDWGSKLKEADAYYSRDAYKDDAMAQGKIMHRGLVKNYEKFVRASREFGLALDDATDQRQQEQLSELETAEGRTYNYWSIATMRTARRLINVLKEDRVDIAEATSRLQAYEESAERMTAAAQLPEADGPAPLPAVEAYRTAAQQRLSRVLQKRPYSDSEKLMLTNDTAALVEGSPASAIRSYNALVGESNALR